MTTTTIFGVCLTSPFLAQGVSSLGQGRWFHWCGPRWQFSFVKMSAQESDSWGFCNLMVNSGTCNGPTRGFSARPWKVFPEGNQLIYGDQSRSDGVPLRHQKAKPLEISETGFFTGWTSFRRPINCVKALKVWVKIISTFIISYRCLLTWYHWQKFSLYSSKSSSLSWEMLFSSAGYIVNEKNWSLEYQNMQDWMKDVD